MVWVTSFMHGHYFIIDWLFTKELLWVLLDMLIVTEVRLHFVQAISVAERVAEERCEPSPGSDGSVVGYHVRLDSARCFVLPPLFYFEYIFKCIYQEQLLKEISTTQSKIKNLKIYFEGWKPILKVLIVLFAFCFSS